ncbi:membrane protein insertion efficiency factor YidD [Geomonas sp. RF6]|uniref:membrane protein insertion efficiency factor YidD n=1 Tax=Geomonas sp. RF6 TaxID=2897342 RepID=UPI001E3E3E24|nr:membrane protein insertion efficiency factor YidD [Geomonas sp. RF6]UFS72182.1 membrane protein insertion efficiency factor YidD [Geomonas sp. RF6]
MLNKTLIGFIKAYQRYVSPFLGSSCRFYPTCSHYSLQSLEKYGPMKGSWLTVLRILKCHPFHPGGYDPVR